MTERPVRVGFVGCGSHANRRMYPSIKQVPEIELVAVCDIDRPKAQETAKRWGAGAVYDDLDRMLESEQLDAAVICGSPQMHFDLGTRCLEHGLHIYVEKPSALSSADARKLADTAAQHKKKGLCGFMKRHCPVYQAAKAIVDSASFGSVHMAEVRFSQGPYVKIWGIEEVMRAFLIGQIVHIFDTVRFMCGEVQSVFARLHEPGEGHGAYAVNVRFANGAVGLLSLNALESDGWNFNEVFRVSGHEQWVEVEDQHHLRFQSTTGWLPEPFRAHPILKNQTYEYHLPQVIQHHSLEVGGYVGEMQDLARCVASDAQPAASLQDCVEALRIGEAVWESAQTGREVSLRDTS